MGKFSDLLIRRIAELKKIQAEPGADYAKDLSTAYAYIQRQADADYLMGALCDGMVALLKELPADKRMVFYVLNTTEAQRNEFRPENYYDAVVKNSRSNTWLVDGKTFGTDWRKNIEALEKTISDAGMDPEQEAEKLLEICLPDDPKFPAKRRTECPEKEIIEGLRNQIAQNDPDAEHKKQILDRAALILTDATSEYLNYLDRKVSGLGNERLSGVDEQVHIASLDNVSGYIAEFQQGRFKDKLPKENSVTGHLRYDAVSYQTENPLTEEDTADLRTLPSPFPPALRTRILNVTNEMEAMGEEYLHSEAFTHKQGEPGYAVFTGEQSQKMYAFIPLINAKNEVSQSLLDGNYEALEQACAKYDGYKQRMDKIMANVKDGYAPLFGSNLNSTRTLLHGKNRMPADYVKDHVSHSRANGLQLVYGFSQNTGVPVRELLENPVKSMEKAARNYTEKRGLSRSGNLGQKLFRALSPDAADLDYDVGWKNNVMLLSRGMTSAAGMASSKQEAGAIESAIVMGGAVSALQIKKELQLWRDLARSTDSRKNALYRCALLLPDEELDMRELAQKIKQAKQHEMPALLKRLRQENKLDLARVVKRSEEILAQAEQERSANAQLSSSFSANEFQTECGEVLKYLLRNATAQEKRTPGYQQLANKVKQLRDEQQCQKLREKKQLLSKTLSDVSVGLEKLTGEKDGLFLSSKNSKEHERMTTALRLLQLKLTVLDGKALPQDASQEERQKLHGLTLADAVNNARDAVYEYRRIKSDNGSKRSYVHEVGTKRATAADELFKPLDHVTEVLQLRSPCERAQNLARRALLRKRRDENWMEENGEKTIARLIYSMGVHYKQCTDAEEEKLMTKAKVEERVADILEDPVFQKMVENEGLDKLAERAIQGRGKLTEAFIQAEQDLKPKNERVKTNQMTVEQKTEFWRNRSLGPQNGQN